MAVAGVKRLPAHLRENPQRRKVLRRCANGLRGIYGLPVYLCGSALLDGNERPRDWDIRIEMPDEQFALRYGGGRKAHTVVMEWEEQGGTGDWKSVRWRWSDDCVKHSLDEMRRTGLCIDFQIYPVTHCRMLYKGKPKLRLDTRRAS